MTKCEHCNNILILSPTLYYFQRRWPKVSPNPYVDRTIPRCKHCEEVEARNREQASEYSQKDNKAIEELEQQIHQARQLISEGVQAEALLKILPDMKARLAEMQAQSNPIKDLEKKIDEAGTLILDGVESKALLKILPDMKEKLMEMKTVRDMNRKACWETFWCVWGKPE